MLDLLYIIASIIASITVSITSILKFKDRDQNSDLDTSSDNE